MNNFYEVMKKTGILQALRKQVSKKDLAEFDDRAAEILAEYNAMWHEMSIPVNQFTEQVKNNGKRTKPYGDKEPDGQHGQLDKPDNDES